MGREHHLLPHGEKARAKAAPVFFQDRKLRGGTDRPAKGPVSVFKLEQEASSEAPNHVDDAKLFRMVKNKQTNRLQRSFWSSS